MLLSADTTRPMEGGPSFALKHRLYRAAWGMAWTALARWTPAPMHGWRRLILRLFGAHIAATARVYGSARIWYPPNLIMGAHSVIGPLVNCYNQDLITIGSYVVVSQGAHLCAGTHDIADPNFQLITRPIRIDDRAWIAAEAFVGPGVSVREGAVLGARGVAFKDLEPWTVYAGNPAKALKSRVFRTPPQ